MSSVLSGANFISNCYNTRKKNLEKNNKKCVCGLDIYTDGGVWGGPPVARARGQRGTIVEHSWNISVEHFHGCPPPPCPCLCHEGAPDVRGEMGVIWAGVSNRSGVCFSPIGKPTVGTALVLCPTDVGCYSLRKICAHLLHTFRAPIACGRAPCLYRYARSGAYLEMFHDVPRKHSSAKPHKCLPRTCAPFLPN